MGLISVTMSRAWHTRVALALQDSDVVQELADAEQPERALS